MTGLTILLSGDALDIAALNASLGDDTRAGARASFTGMVRASDNLTALELLHHPSMTEGALQRIGQHAQQKFGCLSVLIAHRFGKMKPGEPIVHVAANAAHRRAALDSVSYAIDVLKTRAPFWKREWQDEDYRWIEPTAQDHEMATHWLETDR